VQRERQRGENRASRRYESLSPERNAWRERGERGGDAEELNRAENRAEEARHR
jgi:hypothetical protein